MTIKEYNQTVDLYSDGLYRFILKSTYDKVISEDIVQETFAKVWINIRKVEFSKAKNYLFTVGYHCMIDYIRSNKRDREYRATLSYPEAEMPDLELKEALDAALNHLPEIQKSVILLRDYEGYSYEEIEEITGLNASQVKVYIFRARKAMKEILITNKKIFPAY